MAVATHLSSNLFLKKPSFSVQLPLHKFSSSSQKKFCARCSINTSNNPVVYVNNSNNVSVSIQNYPSKFENTNLKSSLIAYKDQKESRGGDNSPPTNGGGGGGGGGGDGDEGDYVEKKFGAPMKFEQEAEEEGVDMLAGSGEYLLMRYLMGPASALRNEFKVGTKTVIDACCAKFAEVQKGGNDFWHEFDLYFSDLVLDVILGFALGCMLPPSTRKPSVASGGLKKSVVLPNSFFKCEIPGFTFPTKQLHSTLLNKGSHWPLKFLSTSFAMLLDKMLPDLQFLFEAGIEVMQIVIDPCCATFAEIQKRGKDLWDKLKTYVVDVLAGKLAPYARTRNRSIASGLNNSVAALPSSDERHQRLAQCIYQAERMSSFYNHTHPMATFSLASTGQRDERMTMVHENVVLSVTMEMMRARVLEFEAV